MVSAHQNSFHKFADNLSALFVHHCFVVHNILEIHDNCPSCLHMMSKFLQKEVMENCTG